MSYLMLRVVHVAGLVLVFMGLAGVLGMKLGGDTTIKKRWIFHVSHGLGLLLLLSSGIALGVQLGLHHPAPGWLQAKAAIWLLAGGAMATTVRWGRFAGAWMLIFAGLAAAAAWLAIVKPF